MRPHRSFFIALLLVVLTATACSSGGSAPTGTAAEIAENIFAEAGVEPFGPTVALETEQDIEFFLGSTNYPPFTDSAVVQPLINVDARLVEVLVVGSSDEADEVKAQLEIDIDPTRLILDESKPLREPEKA